MDSCFLKSDNVQYRPINTNTLPTKDVGRDLRVPPLVCTTEYVDRRGRHP